MLEHSDLASIRPSCSEHGVLYDALLLGAAVVSFAQVAAEGDPNRCTIAEACERMGNILAELATMERELYGDTNASAGRLY